jgi:Co/Zn/Cd efflux system component
MAMPETVVASTHEEPAAPSATRFGWLNWSSLFFAFIQSVCTAFLALHGVRFLIGIGAVILASSTFRYADELHHSALREPMMLIALFGSLLNLAALWQVRRLRARSASAWRQQPLTPAKRRSENLQLLLSVITLVLLAAEWISHFKLTGTL